MIIYLTIFFAVDVLLLLNTLYMSDPIWLVFSSLIFIPLIFSLNHITYSKLQ